MPELICTKPLQLIKDFARVNQPHLPGAVASCPLLLP
jgi:hypothetical protein